MSTVEINSDQVSEELEPAGIAPLYDGPSYEDLLDREAKIASFNEEAIDRSAYEDGVEVGRLMLADELLELAPGGFKSQAEAARWGRWVAYQLRLVTKQPRI